MTHVDTLETAHQPGVRPVSEAVTHRHHEGTDDTENDLILTGIACFFWSLGRVSHLQPHRCCEVQLVAAGRIAFFHGG